MKQLADGTIDRLRSMTQEPDFTGTRYSLVREIARGGMGVVYEAEDTVLRRHVAIKVLPVEDLSPSAAQRLRDEAHTIASLEHPGIIPVHDAGTLPDGRSWYAMKLVRGRTLHEILQEANARADLLRIFVRICETVAYAHAHGKIHGDLKPDNVMVGSFGEVMVMDWGVGTVGTRGFMAPEQERRESLDSRADVFALGAILQLMIGRDKATRALRAIADKACASDRENRYSDALEVAADVIRFVDGERVLAHRENVMEQAQRWVRRHQALVAMVLAYMIMRAAVFFWSRL